MRWFLRALPTHISPWFHDKACKKQHCSHYINRWSFYEQQQKKIPFYIRSYLLQMIRKPCGDKRNCQNPLLSPDTALGYPAEDFQPVFSSIWEKDSRDVSIQHITCSGNKLISHEETKGYFVQHKWRCDFITQINSFRKVHLNTYL